MAFIGQHTQVLCAVVQHTHGPRCSVYTAQGFRLFSSCAGGVPGSGAFTAVPDPEDFGLDVNLLIIFLPDEASVLPHPCGPS